MADGVCKKPKTYPFHSEWELETGCVQLWAWLQSANWCCAVTVMTWAFGRFYTVLGELLCIISGYMCYGSFHLMKPADNGEWELTSFNKNPSLVRERESGYQDTDQQSLSLQHSPGFKYLLQNKRQHTAGLHLWVSPKKEFTLPHTAYSGWSPWEAITLTLAMSTIMRFCLKTHYFLSVLASRPHWDCVFCWLKTL